MIGVKRMLVFLCLIAAALAPAAANDVLAAQLGHAAKGGHPAAHEGTIEIEENAMRVTPQILAGVFALAAWASLFLIAFFCLHNVDPCTRFVSKGIAINKEY